MATPGHAAKRRIVHSLRHFIRSHRAIAALVVALALAMKLAVPAGFMPTMADGRIVVAVCSGAGSTTMIVEIPGLKHERGDTGGGAKHEPPCAFAGLSMPALAGADPVLLAIAILFVMAMALRPVAALRVVQPQFLRPPLRAPPATA